MKGEEEKELENLSPFEVKNTLIKISKSNHFHTMINAGRGNPNWVATVPREAFFKLGEFALIEAKLDFTDAPGFGGIANPEGIVDRFLKWADANSCEGVELLKNSLLHCNSKLGIPSTDLVVEWVDGILGDNYPVPDRMLAGTEKIVHEYLLKEMCVGQKPPGGKYDIFAVEGGTAAMVYIFNTLKTNGFLKAGDTIAMGTPIFTPYIEMPELEDYNLNQIRLLADPENGWQIPLSELDKLRDPKVKAFFLVNPSNPPSVRMSDEVLAEIAKIAKERPELILLTDDVYGTFTDNFKSLAMIAPKNTILVYSFSKYFGATGWRLGVIAVHEDNNFDLAIANRSDKEKARLKERYHGITLDVSKLKFIDRFVADSRAVALNHTAGLSTPQQIQMALFSLFCVLDQDNNYKKIAKQIVRDRYKTLFDHTKYPPLVPLEDENGAFYYVEIDVKKEALVDYGENFVKWLEKNYEPLDFIVRLSEDFSVVGMDGVGFASPAWTLRISLANLNTKDYAKIGHYMDSVLKGYEDEYLAQINK
ncbi:MAG: bifunctional aspartate transaminase/aspartate 4-decarboxylase [Lentisphaeria bacterium]|nr:bifunctional aspartate transaminase/aspartate 4-decarboxylase [Lentisphaeria bacterium]